MTNGTDGTVLGRMVFGRADEIGTAALEQMFRLRCRIFRERLGWRVDATDGQERDGFDAHDPYYLVALDGAGARAIGCWRLLPTTGETMLGGTFSTCLRGDPMPVRREVWELSRFTIDGGAGGGQIRVNDVAIAMMDRLIRFADARGIEQYVTVVALPVERLMRRAGIELERFGDALPSDLDGVRSVACRVGLGAATRAAVAARLPREAETALAAA